MQRHPRTKLLESAHQGGRGVFRFSHRMEDRDGRGYLAGSLLGQTGGCENVGRSTTTLNPLLTRAWVFQKELF